MNNYFGWNLRPGVFSYTIKDAELMQESRIPVEQVLSAVRAMVYDYTLENYSLSYETYQELEKICEMFNQYQKRQRYLDN